MSSSSAHKSRSYSGHMLLKVLVITVTEAHGPVYRDPELWRLSRLVRHLGLASHLV